MSSTPDQQVISNEPPDFARPFIEQGMGGANALLQQGGPQQYGGSTVVPFSQQTQMAQDLTTARALGGSAPVNAASGYTTDVLGGNYLNSNPWLDQTFDRAAGQVGQNLDSFFARSGRDLEAQAPQRVEALNNLATSIYGGNYQQERDRQQQAVGFAPGLANQDWLNLGQLGGVGSQIEGLAGRYQQDNQNRFNFEQMRPEQALDAYIQRVMGQSSNYGQQSQPIYQNQGASALGGAAVGSQLGFGPWGTVFGGLLGGFG